MKLDKIIFSLIFIISCGKKIENSNIKSENNVNYLDTVIPFHGFWVSEKYISSLIETKSPRASQDFGLFFQATNSYKEKAFIFLYHEGSDEGYIFKRGNSYFLRSDFYVDSTEIVMIDKGSKILIKGKIFIRIKENIGIPEDILFNGLFRAGEKTVNFKSDGTVSGLDSINYYSVENDYFGPGMGDVDILYLGRIQEESLTHCFEFKQDTLLIFDIDCIEVDEDGTCLDIQKGQLKWNLVRN
jgi:hypothetical protein